MNSRRRLISDSSRHGPKYVPLIKSFSLAGPDWVRTFQGRRNTVRLIRYYCHWRGIGLRLAWLKSGDGAMSSTFGWLWTARQSMNKHRREQVGGAIAETQLDVLKRRGAVSRPEFGFLWAWNLGLDWAMPRRHLYLSARHGISELREVVDLGPKRAATVLMGGSSWKRGYGTQWESPGTLVDDEPVSENANFPWYLFEYYFEPRLDELYAKLKQFVSDEPLSATVGPVM